MPESVFIEQGATTMPAVLNEPLEMLAARSSSRCTWCASFSTCPDIQDPKAPIEGQAFVLAKLMGSSAGYIEDASFTRLRELTMTLTAPREWASKVRASSLALTFGAQNLATWSNYSGFDPEVQAAANAANSFASNDFFSQAPLRRYTSRISLTF